MKNKLQIVYLGESGFPKGLAAIQKMTLIGKSLLAVGAKITVLNRKGKFNPNEKIDLDLAGTHEGIAYLYTSGTIYRPSGFWKRNWQKVRGKYQEFKQIQQFREQENKVVGIVSTESLFQVFSYFLYSKMLRFPLVINYVEMLSAMQHRKGLYKINDYLLDRFLIKRMDAALPISELLLENFNKIAPNKPTLKIPVLCDFSLFDLPKRTPEVPYFLYCGAISYKEVVDFILAAFAKIAPQTDTYLYLIVSGGKAEAYEQLQVDLEQHKLTNKVKIFKNIPYSLLVDLYLHAQALLIPLRPTVQDAARFPHKIGEYLATGNPIITTNYGEVRHYFKDDETALIADTYDINAYAEKMQAVLDQPEKAKAIGEAGKQLGLREFNYLSYGEKLKHFLQKI